LVAVSVAVFYMYQTIQEKNKVKKLNLENDYLSDVISSCNFKITNLEQQIYHSKETIEKQKQEKNQEA
jgi:PIN domain nuclease of toxin-antitoxin system